jgi:coenzyme F420-reducing hydrogenase beta subunit
MYSSLLTSAEVLEFKTKEAYYKLGLRCNTSESYEERQKKKLQSKLAPTAYLSEKICNPYDGEDTVWSQ